MPYNNVERVRKGVGGIFMDITPIARIRSDFPEKFGLPRQSGLVEELTATVVFEPSSPRRALTSR